MKQDFELFMYSGLGKSLKFQDLVLPRVMLNTQKLNRGSQEPTCEGPYQTGLIIKYSSNMAVRLPELKLTI